MEDRRQAGEAPGHGRQAERRQGLRDRRQAAGDAERCGHGLPGAPRQAGELRRGQGREHARRAPRRQGERWRRRSRRRHLVAGEVHKLDLGGGFGRRGGTQDYTRQAVAIAKQFPGVPVKLIWSREEDQAHDFYRPISQCKLSAGLDESGKLLGMHIRVSGQSINAWLNPGAIKEGKDVRQLQGLWKEPGDAQFGYTVPNLQIEYAMRNTHVPVGPWRGVNTNQNGVYLECFMEEVARAAGKDSLEFRRELMANHPKHLGVLNAGAGKAGWGKPLTAGVHRGI